MNKEEVLAKSRSETQDEGMREAENQGRRLGITAFTLLETVIVVFNSVNGQSNYVPFALFWIFTAAEAYPKYRFTQKQSFLITTILSGLAAILFFVCHVVDVLM